MLTLVTGATGRVGRRFRAVAVAERGILGYEVRVLVRDAASGSPDPCQAVPQVAGGSALLPVGRTRRAQRHCARIGLEGDPVAHLNGCLCSALSKESDRFFREDEARRSLITSMEHIGVTGDDRAVLGCRCLHLAPMAGLPSAAMSPGSDGVHKQPQPFIDGRAAGCFGQSEGAPGNRVQVCEWPEGERVEPMGLR